MRFKLFIENTDKRRVIASIGSEHLEHLVKTTPIQVDFGNFKETWYLFFTLWQSSELDHEGGGGRILMSPEPDTNSFDGGIVWIHENNEKVISSYYMDQYSKAADPFIADAAKKLGIHSMLDWSDNSFAAKYGFKLIKATS